MKKSVNPHKVPGPHTGLNMAEAAAPPNGANGPDPRYAFMEREDDADIAEEGVPDARIRPDAHRKVKVVRPSSSSDAAGTTGLSACSVASRAVRAARALVAVERRATHWSACDIGGVIWVERRLWVERG